MIIRHPEFDYQSNQNQGRFCVKNYRSQIELEFHVRGKFKVAVTIVAHCSDTGNERAGLTFDLLRVVVRRTTTYLYVHVEGPRRRGNCLGN